MRGWLASDSFLGAPPEGVEIEESRAALLDTLSAIAPVFVGVLALLYALVGTGHLLFHSGSARWWMAGASGVSLTFFAGVAWLGRRGRLRPGALPWVVLLGSVLVVAQALLHAHLTRRSGLLALPAAVLLLAPVLQPLTPLVLVLDGVAALLWGLVVRSGWMQVPPLYHAVWFTAMALVGLALHAGFQLVLLRLHAHQIAHRNRAVALEAALSALRAVRDKYDLLAENVSDVLWIRDLDLRPVFVSPSVARLRGYTASEVMIQRPAEIFDAASLARAKAWLAQEIARDADPAVDPDRSRVVELAVPHKDGHLVWTEARVRFLRDAQGRPSGIVGVSRDITERREAEARLRAVLADLRRSNQELEEFACVASHDLKEPLRVVASQLRMLERREAETLSDRGRRYLGHAVRGAERMQALIDGLLAYSRAGAGAVVYAPVPLDAVVQEAWEQLSELAREAGARLERAADLPTVWGDRRKLTHLLQNLLSNGLKFRGAAPCVVRVGAEPLGGERVTISVQDNGIGIAAEHHARVVRIFERLHSHDEIPGTGIGLALCKRIVEQHGGALRIDSAEGAGTTVRFDLPAAAPAAAEHGDGETGAAASSAVLLTPEVDEEERAAGGAAGRERATDQGPETGPRGQRAAARKDGGKDATEALDGREGHRAGSR